MIEGPKFKHRKTENRPDTTEKMLTAQDVKHHHKQTILASLRTL